jgi:hypothetical protein
MSIHDDDRSGDDGVYEQPASNRDPGRRRTQIALGAVGAAALLGAGAYVITAQIMDHRDSTVTRDAGALAPIVAPTSDAPSGLPSVAPSDVPSPEASAPSSGPAKDAVKKSASPSPSHSLSVEEQIKRAREKAAKDGYPVQRALTAGPHVQSGPVNERSEEVTGGTLRVITAKFDLTGQRELLWPANGGKSVGGADCTQTFRFANNAKPSTKPNLLLCWRTSADRSVVTVLVNRNGKPSTAESVKVIDREWAKLG